MIHLRDSVYTLQIPTTTMLVFFVILRKIWLGPSILGLPFVPRFETPTPLPLRANFTAPWLRFCSCPVVCIPWKTSSWGMEIRWKLWTILDTDTLLLWKLKDVRKRSASFQRQTWVIKTRLVSAYSLREMAASCLSILVFDAAGQIVCRCRCS